MYEGFRKIRNVSWAALGVVTTLNLPYFMGYIGNIFMAVPYTLINNAERISKQSFANEVFIALNIFEKVITAPLILQPLISAEPWIAITSVSATAAMSTLIIDGAIHLNYKLTGNSPD